MKPEELSAILDGHARWLNGSAGGVRANLRGAHLSWANLREANLREANLRGADLSWANLREANLREANLRGAYLGGANLGGANLGGANLGGANLPHFQIPQTGTLEVYKRLEGGRIARLLIPADARRTGTPIGRKCRAERALVMEITASDGTSAAEGRPLYDRPGVYRVGEMFVPDSYDDDIRVECTHGVHFYLTREEC